jgi:hypothetical protein
MSLSKITPKFRRHGFADWPKLPRYCLIPGIASSGAITNVSVLSAFNCREFSLNHYFISIRQWSREFSFWISDGLKEQ